MPNPTEPGKSPPTEETEESRNERLDRIVEEARRKGEQQPGTITITVPPKKG